MQTQALQLRPYGYIYKLTNKINGKCYIGQSINKPEKCRWLNYRRLNCKGQPKLYNALKKYGPDNFTYEIVETGFNKDNLDFLEDTYEIWCNSIDNGYNIRRGGANGKMSEESKRKLSKSNIGRIISKETRQKISKANKGRKMSAEQNKRNSETHKGKTSPKEARQKISKALKGRTYSSETLQKISNTLKGHICHQETRQKISNTLKGHKASEESNQKRSKTLKGRIFSIETRQKLSESHKRRYQLKCIANGFNFGDLNEKLF